MVWSAAAPVHVAGRPTARRMSCSCTQQSRMRTARNSVIVPGPIGVCIGWSKYALACGGERVWRRARSSSHSASTSAPDLSRRVATSRSFSSPIGLRTWAGLSPAADRRRGSPSSSRSMPMMCESRSCTHPPRQVARCLPLRLVEQGTDVGQRLPCRGQEVDDLALPPLWLLHRGVSLAHRPRSGRGQPCLRYRHPVAAMTTSVIPAGFASLWERYPWPDRPPFPDVPMVGRNSSGFELLTELIDERPGPTVVMEIGAEFGGSTRRFLGIAKPGSCCRPMARFLSIQLIPRPEAIRGIGRRDAPSVPVVLLELSGSARGGASVVARRAAHGQRCWRPRRLRVHRWRSSV